MNWTLFYHNMCPSFVYQTEEKSQKKEYLFASTSNNKNIVNGLHLYCTFLIKAFYNASCLHF